MQPFVRDLGSEVATTGPQVPVVQMPDGGGPGVIQHPLNHAGRSVLVSAEGLEHGALALVSLHLALVEEVFKPLSLAVPGFERRRENVDVPVTAAPRVKIPPGVDGPPMLDR